jgi:outer membrane receptor protein involved in Fe transport
VVSGIGGNHTGRVDMNNNGLPDITVTLEDGRDLATALAAGELGNDDYGLHYIGLSGTDVKDTVTGFTLGGTWKVEAGSFKSLSFGAARTERGKTRDTVENDTNGGSCQYCNHYDTTFTSLGADVVRDVSLPNFMRGGGGHFPRTFIRFDVPPIYKRCTGSTVSPSSTRTAIRPAMSTTRMRLLPELNPVQSYDVEEDTDALYVKADFGAEQWYASAGVRWISTDTTARTAINEIVFVDDPTPEVPTSSPDVTYSEAEPLTQEGSYDKLLPSFNAGYWFNDELVLRVGAARVMARPSLNQLAPTRTDNTLDRTFRGVLRRQCGARTGIRGPGGSVDGVVFRREVGAQCRGVLEEHRGLHHL